MRSLKALLGAGRRALSQRLDRLHETVALLTERLRRTVAQALGETVGETVRETFLSALEESEVPTMSTAPSYRSPYASPGSWRDRGTSAWDRGYDPDPYEPDPYGRDYDPRYSSEPDPAPAAEQLRRPNRLAVALATGLRTAAFWASRWCGRGVVLVAALVTLAAGGAAYLGGGLVETGLGLLESVGHVAALGEAARRGAQALAPDRYP